MEIKEGLIIQLIERIAQLESKVENLVRSTDDTNARLTEIERSYQKSLGAIWVAISIAGIAVTMSLALAQLWIEKQIRDYHQLNNQGIEKHESVPKGR